jgi:enoyl-CoA hydratase/carnithine racemase
MAEILVSNSDGVQVIRMTRPAKKNALTSTMYAAMTEALVAGDAAPDVAVHLFAGSSGVFCAGNDINDFLKHSSKDGGLGDQVVNFIRALPTTRKPMIAAVDGLAIGVGTTMLLHCDLVYASPAASFRTPFLDLGILPEAGSSLLMPRRMGHVRAFEMLALGATYSAEQAREAGLINAVVTADRLEAAALDAGRRLATKPPEALALARKLMRGDPTEVMARIDAEITEFARRLASPEAKEAFQAFLEKRPPDFKKLNGR